MADFDKQKVILTKWPNDQNDRTLLFLVFENLFHKKYFENFGETFENRNGGVISLQRHSNDRLASGKRRVYFGKEAALLRESEKNPIG